MMGNTPQRQLAKDFIDRANGGTGPTGTWRLEVLQKRLAAGADGRQRTDGDGNPKEIPVRIRRFLKGIPWAQVHHAIRYLVSQSPYTGLICNGVELEGSYRPTLTQWRRDDQEQVGGNAQGSYTLVQDLIEVTEDGDALDTTSSESCSETELTRWVWDAPGVEDLPHSGGQGVTFAIRQMRRNEDGTFDYAVVKRKARTQVSDWTVTECDEYSRTSVKVFDNVYGGLTGGDPFVTDTGADPGILDPCRLNDGVLVQIQKAQNPDCTFRITMQKTEAVLKVTRLTDVRKSLRGVTESETVVATQPHVKTGLRIGEQVRNELRQDGLYDVTHVTTSKESVGDVGSTCETTVFQHTHVKNENVATRPEKEASTAGGGKTYQVQARATDEGTWDVSRTETTEIAQAGAQRTRQKTLRGVTETTVDRNVDNSDVTVTNIGDRVQVEMTPGGRYNRTVTTVSKESVGDVGSTCETTVFQHTHVKNENVATRPGEEASTAGDGKTYQVQARATEEGTWDVSRTETTEIARTGAQRTRQKTLRGITETTVDRNVDNSDVTVTNIGDRVQVEMTPGGRYNRTVTTVSKESVGDVGSTCETTVFQHTHVKNENVATRPGEEASTAGDGKTYQVQARATEEGTWDVSRTVIEEKQSTNAQRSRRKTLRAVFSSHVDRNVANSSVTVTNIGDEVRVERTPGGLYNRTVTTVSATPAGRIGSTCETTVFQHTHVRSENVSQRPGEDASTAGGGKTYQVQARATEEGTWDVSRTETTEITRKGAQRTRQKTLRGVTETTIDRNVDNSDVTVTNIGDRVQVEMTPGGRYNRIVTTVSKESVGDVGSTCETTVFQHTHVRSENVSQRPEEGAATAGDGKTYQVQARATEEGTWDVSRTETMEIARTGAQRTRQKTLRGVTETTIDRNVDNSDVTVVNIGDRVQVEMTPGGRYNRTVTTVSAEPVGTIGRSVSVSKATRTEVEVTNVPGSEIPYTNLSTPEENYEVSDEYRMTEEGTWDFTHRTVRHAELKRSPVATVTFADKTVRYHTVKNAPELGSELSSPGPGKTFSGFSAQLNDHGSVDARWEEVEAQPMTRWEAVVNINNLYSRTVWFRTAAEDQYKSLINSVVTEFGSKMSSWIGNDRGPTTHDVSVNVTPTEFRDRFDGRINVIAKWASDAAGQTGAANVVLFYHNADTTETEQIGTGGRRRQRQHFVYQGKGRGERELVRLMSVAPKLGTFSDSFSFSPDSTWTFTRTETTNWSY